MRTDWQRDIIELIVPFITFANVPKIDTFGQLPVRFEKQLNLCAFRMVIITTTKTKKLNSVALVRTRTIPTERTPPVGEVSANFCG